MNNVKLIKADAAGAFRLGDAASVERMLARHDPHILPVKLIDQLLLAFITLSARFIPFAVVTDQVFGVADDLP